MCLLTVIFPYSFGDILAKWWIRRYNNNDYEYEYEYEYDRSFRKRQIQMEENHTDQHSAYKRVFKYRHYPSPLSKIDPSIQKRFAMSSALNILATVCCVNYSIYASS